MRCYRGYPDVEMQGQTRDKAEVKTLEKKEKKTRTNQVQDWILSKKLKEVKNWIRTILQPKNLLLVLCVISVAVDPLFFYLPVINEERKCVVLDRRLYIIAICLRTVLDSISLVNIIWQCFHLSNYIDERAGQLQERQKLQNGTPIPFEDAQSKAKSRYLWSLAIEVLAILPIPQVLIRIIFSKMRGSQYLNGRKVLTAVVLFQYLPRALRIYTSWKNAFMHRNPRINLSKRVIEVKATFNLILYIVASHVLGGVWYFFSVERETACWHIACENHIECDRRSSFDCNHDFGNYTFLNDYCPIHSPNTTFFDFGIFQGALESGTVASMDFMRKTMFCFWWGLRNLSSFGSNLQTSPHFWENCFSVFTSMLGLLLFLYFLGHLQMYMQLEATWELDEAKKFEEKEERRKSYMDFKKEKILKWVDRNPWLGDKKEVVISEVPMLKKISYGLSARISMNLKPVNYDEHTYIFREGEPIDMMLFITRGILLKFPITSTSSGETVEYIEQGNFYGLELLQWAGLESSSPPSLSKLPISTTTLKTHTKVEAFGLMADDLKAQLSKINEEAVLTIQSARRHFLRKAKRKTVKTIKSWFRS